MRKRILSLLLCIVLCLSMLPMSAFAQELPSMQNVRINPQGILSWDEVSGAAGYYVGIKSGETIRGDNFATSSGVNLNSFCRRYSSICDHTGDYTVVLYAWDSHADMITEIWTGSYHFVLETQQQTTYTVTFDMNGHGDSITALTVNEGDQLSKPADPVAEGWKFEGWYKNEALTEEYNFGAMVFENITLYAKWVEIEHYTVTYDANGGTGSMPSEQIYVNSEGIAIYSFPTCGFTAPEGKKFDHWDVEGNNNTFSEADQLAIFGDVIVKPIWAEDLAPMQNVNISDKGILSWDAFPNAAKYTVAVSSNPIGPYWGVDTTELSNNLFDLCSRSNLTKGKTAYVKLAACGSDGNYISEEWIGEFLYPTTAQGCYYVTFESNGGGGEMPLTPVYANNTGFFFTLPQCEFTAPTGKKFDHWDVEGNCKQHSGGTELELFGNIILKPIWVDAEAGPEYFTVSFDANGGSGSMQDVQIPTVDGSFGFYTFPDCGFTAPEGKQFDHWKCLDSDVVKPGDEWLVLSNLVVKAVWKDAATPQPTTYTVSFNMNGRGNQVADQTINAGEKVTEPAEPTEIGYMFVGWYKDSEFNTAWNFDTDTVTADTTLYALWAKNIANYTVTFNMNGHGNQVEAQTVKEGEKAAKPADPTASGWTFGGWYKEAACSTAFSFDTAITADTKVYAKWTENTVKPADPEKPNKPEKPEKPEKPVKPAKPGKPASPNTADTNQALLWVMLMILGGALAGAELYSRKRKN